MTITTESKTYLPEEEVAGRFAELVTALEASSGATPQLVVDGQSIELTPSMAEVLLQVADAMRRGQAVTVAPLEPPDLDPELLPDLEPPELLPDLLLPTREPGFDPDFALLLLPPLVVDVTLPPATVLVFLALRYDDSNPPPLEDTPL